MIRNIAYPLFLIFFLMLLLFTCNVMDKQQSQQQRWLHQQEQLGKGYRWLYQDSLIGIRALAKIAEGELLFENLSIFVRDSVQYYQQQCLFTTQFDQFPMVQHLPNDQHEVLIGFVDNNQNYRILQILLENNQIHTDTLPLFDGQTSDIDQDGKIEWKGYLSADEPYCDNCDSVYYNPLLFYENSKQGHQLDSNLSRQWCIQHYGSFEGFQPQKQRIVPLKTNSHFGL